MLEIYIRVSYFTDEIYLKLQIRGILTKTYSGVNSLREDLIKEGDYYDYKVRSLGGVGNIVFIGVFRTGQAQSLRQETIILSSRDNACVVREPALSASLRCPRACVVREPALSASLRCPL
jgi:hypothetical protein